MSWEPTSWDSNEATHGFFWLYTQQGIKYMWNNHFANISI